MLKLYLLSVWLCLGFDILIVKALRATIEEDYIFVKKKRNDYEHLVKNIRTIFLYVIIASLPIFNVLYVIVMVFNYEEISNKSINILLEEKRIVKKEK